MEKKPLLPSWPLTEAQIKYSMSCNGGTLLLEEKEAGQSTKSWVLSHFTESLFAKGSEERMINLQNLPFTKIFEVIFKNYFNRPKCILSSTCDKSALVLSIVHTRLHLRKLLSKLELTEVKEPGHTHMVHLWLNCGLKPSVSESITWFLNNSSTPLLPFVTYQGRHLKRSIYLQLLWVMNPLLDEKTDSEKLYHTSLQDSHLFGSFQ